MRVCAAEHRRWEATHTRVMLRCRTTANDHWVATRRTRVLLHTSLTAEVLKDAWQRQQHRHPRWQPQQQQHQHQHHQQAEEPCMRLPQACAAVNSTMLHATVVCLACLMPTRATHQPRTYSTLPVRWCRRDAVPLCVVRGWHRLNLPWQGGTAGNDAGCVGSVG